VRPQIPVLKEVQPLLEMDRDERKLDVFLTFHRSSLLVSDMKIFLPFTINLDPYIKKKIKEEQQSIEEDANLFYKQGNVWHSAPTDQWHPQRSVNRHVKLSKQSSLGSVPPTPSWGYQPSFEWQVPPTWMQMPPMEPVPKPLSATTTLSVDINCASIVLRNLEKMSLIVSFLFIVRNFGNKTLVSNGERRLRFNRQNRKLESSPGTSVQASHQRQQH